MGLVGKDAKHVFIAKGARQNTIDSLKKAGIQATDDEAAKLAKMKAYGEGIKGRYDELDAMLKGDVVSTKGSVDVLREALKGANKLGDKSAAVKTMQKIFDTLKASPNVNAKSARSMMARLQEKGKADGAYWSAKKALSESMEEAVSKHADELGGTYKTVSQEYKAYVNTIKSFEKAVVKEGKKADKGGTFLAGMLKDAATFGVLGAATGAPLAGLAVGLGRRVGSSIVKEATDTSRLAAAVHNDAKWVKNVLGVVDKVQRTSAVTARLGEKALKSRAPALGAAFMEQGFFGEKPKDYHELHRQIQHYAQAPQEVAEKTQEAFSGSMKSSAVVTSVSMRNLQRTIQKMSELLPPPSVQQVGMLAAVEAPVSRETILTAQNIFDAAFDPVSAFDRLSLGQASIHDLRVLRAMYPAMTEHYLKTLGVASQRGGRAPSAAVQGLLSILTKKPQGVLWQQTHIAALQEPHIAKRQEGQGQGANGSSLTAMNNVNAKNLTGGSSADQLEGDMT